MHQVIARRVSTWIRKIIYWVFLFKFLRFIEHYSKWLPPNHYYVCDVELTLTQAIGSGDPKNLQLITDKQLHMKIDLCRKLLKLFEILAAGSFNVDDFSYINSNKQLQFRKMGLQLNRDAWEHFISSCMPVWQSWLVVECKTKIVAFEKQLKIH